MSHEGSASRPGVGRPTEVREVLLNRRGGMASRLRASQPSADLRYDDRGALLLRPEGRAPHRRIRRLRVPPVSFPETSCGRRFAGSACPEIRHVDSQSRREYASGRKGGRYTRANVLSTRDSKAPRADVEAAIVCSMGREFFEDDVRKRTPEERNCAREDAMAHRLAGEDEGVSPSGRSAKKLSFFTLESRGTRGNSHSCPVSHVV